MKRTYGHDETANFEALVEAERLEDGFIHFRSVLYSKDGEDTPDRTTRM